MRDKKDSDQRRTSSEEGRWLLNSKAFGSSNIRDSPMIAGRFPLLFISLTLLVIDWFLHYLSPPALRLRRRSSATPVLCIYRTLYKILIRRSIYVLLLKNHSMNVPCPPYFASIMVATRYMGSPRRLCYPVIDDQHQAPSICYCVGTDGVIVAPGPILSLLIYCSVRLLLYI